MVHPVEHIPLVKWTEKSMIKSASTLLKGKVGEINAPNEHTIDKFEPNYGLMHNAISDVIKLEENSKTRSCAGCKLLECYKNSNLPTECMVNKN